MAVLFTSSGCYRQKEKKRISLLFSSPRRFPREHMPGKLSSASPKEKA